MTENANILEIHYTFKVLEKQHSTSMEILYLYTAISFLGAMRGSKL